MKKYLKDKNVILKIRINDKIKNKFINYCEKNNISISEKIRLLISEEMKNV